MLLYRRERRGRDSTIVGGKCLTQFRAKSIMKTQKKVWESKKNGEFQFLLPFVPCMEGRHGSPVHIAGGGRRRRRRRLRSVLSQSR